MSCTAPLVTARLSMRPYREDDLDALIGFCGLRLMDGGPEVELMYGLAPAHWGRGLVTEGAAAWLARGFERDGRERIWALTDAPNLRAGVVVAAGVPPACARRARSQPRPRPSAAPSHRNATRFAVRRRRRQRDGATAGSSTSGRHARARRCRDSISSAAVSGTASPGCASRHAAVSARRPADSTECGSSIRHSS